MAGLCKGAHDFAGLVARSMQKPAWGCAAPHAELCACALKIGKAKGKTNGLHDMHYYAIRYKKIFGFCRNSTTRNSNRDDHQRGIDDLDLDVGEIKWKR